MQFLEMQKLGDLNFDVGSRQACQHAQYI